MNLKSSSIIAVSLISILTLTACGGASCTQDDITSKVNEITTKMTALAATGDMDKINAMNSKMAEIQNMSDQSEVCRYYDDVLKAL